MSKPHRVIYEREYDNPKNEDGTMKPNKLLGKFRVEERLRDDMYSEQFIGVKGGKRYLITEHEVSGYYNAGQGGSRYEVKLLAQSPPTENGQDNG